MMFGKITFLFEGHFSGAMLNFRSVYHKHNEYFRILQTFNNYRDDSWFKSPRVFLAQVGVQWDFCRKMRSVDMPLCTASRNQWIHWIFCFRLNWMEVMFFRYSSGFFLMNMSSITKTPPFGWGFLSLQAVRNHAKQLWRWVSSEKLVGVVCVFFRFLPYLSSQRSNEKTLLFRVYRDETLPSNMRLYRAQMLLLLFVPKWSMVIHQHLSVGVPKKKNKGWQGVVMTPTTWFMGWNNSHYSRVISPQLLFIFSTICKGMVFSSM